MRSATVDALTSASSAVSVISSHSESAGIPVWASRSATRPANDGVDDLAGADVDGEVGAGEREVARPPAGELGQRVLEDRRPDLLDEPGLLGHRQELVRRQQAPLGVQPAGQRLEPDDVTGRELDDRLEVRHDLAPLDPRRSSAAVRSASTVVSCEPGAKASTQSRPLALARYIAASASRRRSAADTPGPVVHRHADAGGDEQLGAVDDDRLAHRLPDALGRSPARRRRPCSTTMNSSPPNRASTASGPTTSRRRTDIAVSSVSPMPWPRLSLTDLKLSRSMKRSDTSPTSASCEDGVDAGEQLGAVGQAGQVVVGRRPLQSLGGPPLLGDVLDVGDGERHALVLGDGDPRPGPHELAVAAQVALVEQVRVGDAELEPGPVRRGRPQVLRVGDLADAAPDEVLDRAVEHVGERPVGVEDDRVVEAHERHARWVRSGTPAGSAGGPARAPGPGPRVR